MQDKEYESMKGKYLSDIIDVEDFGSYCLNLIEAPCGSGKTEFVKRILEPFINKDDWQEILFLIDTKVGAEQLEITFRDTNVTVMTYAKYANIIKNSPEKDYWNSYNSVIVCDEFHNLIQWSKWGNNDIHRFAYDVIFNKIYLRGFYEN
jgi:type I site-specific restriction endonuclease